MTDSLSLDVLMACPLLDDLSAWIESEHNATRLWEQSDRAAFLAAHGARFEVLATTGAIGADKALIDALPNLRLIASFGVGVDPIDVDAVRARGIAVTNTPGVLNACVADLALGLLLALARRIAEGDRFVRAGQWTSRRLPFGTALGGKRCGIVGMGGIGREIAKRVSACGMRVAYHGPRRKADLDFPFHDSLVGLASESDVLVLALPGGDATRHIVNAQVLDALGPRGMFVNVARGSVVDEHALVDALNSGALGGAALDVFEHEPNVPASLRALDNVVLAPHSGSATVETRFAMGDLVRRNIDAFAHGAPLVTPL